jgi:hypothetical protein
MTDEIFPYLDPEAAAQVKHACATYRGDADHVAYALGALLFGQLYGFKGLAMAYTRPAMRRSEALLGIKLREHMPDRTDLSRRLLGVRVADEVGKFWAVVRGDHFVVGKGVADDLGQSDLFKAAQ